MTYYGLSEKGAEASRKKYGLNELLYRPSLGRAVRDGFGGMSCRLFTAAALAEVIAALLGLTGLADIPADFRKAVLFIGAAVLCGFLETAAGYRSDKLLNSSRGAEYTVFRDDGKTKRVPKNMLAVGDAVFLSEGDEIPADGAVAEGLMTVDQSVFGVLGKAEKTAPPQGMRTGGTLGVNNPYFVYGGSEVCGGNGIVKITAVGRDTRIAGKNASKSEKPAEIRGKSFDGIARAGVAAGALAALAVLALGFFRGVYSENAAEGLAKGVSGAAAVMAVACLCGKGLLYRCAAARAVKRLGKKGVSVSDPNILEKGSEIGIALTERSGMLAEAEYSPKGLTFIDGNGKEYAGFGRLDPRLAEVVKNAVVCTSEAVMTADGTALGGSPLDRALYGFVGKKAENVRNMKKQAKVRADSGSVLSGTTVTLGDKLFTFVRGGAEILLDRCSDSLGANGKRQKITNKSALQKLAATISLTGKDVIALAVSGRGIKGGQLPSGGYALIGLFALYDEFFDCAAEETARLEKMGVKTILVTEQSRESAIFGAKLAGIRKNAGVVLDSDQLAKMSDSDLADKLDDISAIVRAVPSDKRRMIRAAHDKGIKVCAAVSEMKSARAVSEAELVLSAPGCRTAVRSASDASAERCGIKAAADVISYSSKYAVDCKARIAARTVCAFIAAAALIFF